MKFVRLEAGWVNMDKVTHILKQGDGVRLYFAAPMESPWTGVTISDYLDLFGDDRKALDIWLSINGDWLNG